jgi:hypothetical protein
MIQSFNEYVTEKVSKNITASLIDIPVPSILAEKKYTELFLLGNRLNGIGETVFRVYLRDSVNNIAIPIEESAKILRKMYPKFSRIIMENASIKSPKHLLSLLYSQNQFNSINLIVNESLVIKTKISLNKSNGIEGSHGFYNFKPENIHIIGLDFDHVKDTYSISLLESVSKGDFSRFTTFINTKSFKNGLQFFNQLRGILGLNEMYVPNQLKLDAISNIREEYVNGTLLKQYDKVRLKNNPTIVGEILYCGSNYVTIKENITNVLSRQWLENIEKI